MGLPFPHPPYLSSSFTSQWSVPHLPHQGLSVLTRNTTSSLSRLPEATFCASFQKSFQKDTFSQSPLLSTPTPPIIVEARTSQPGVLQPSKQHLLAVFCGFGYMNSFKVSCSRSASLLESEVSHLQYKATTLVSQSSCIDRNNDQATSSPRVLLPHTPPHSDLCFVTL